MGQNSTGKIAGVGPCFHLPGFYLGYRFLTHSQMGLLKAFRGIEAYGADQFFVWGNVKLAIRATNLRFGGEPKVKPSYTLHEPGTPSNPYSNHQEPPCDQQTACLAYCGQFPGAK